MVSRAWNTALHHHAFALTTELTSQVAANASPRDTTSIAPVFAPAFRFHTALNTMGMNRRCTAMLASDATTETNSCMPYTLVKLHLP